MNEHPSPDLRIGDTERHQAIEALGEHVGAGRLTVDEYGERTARVTTAKTRRDLLAVFSDLPDPRPAFAGAVPRLAPAAPVARPSQKPWRSPAIVPVVGALAVGLLLLFGKPVVLLLVPLAVLLVASGRGGRRR